MVAAGAIYFLRCPDLTWKKTDLRLSEISSHDQLRSVRKARVGPNSQCKMHGPSLRGTEASQLWGSWYELNSLGLGTLGWAGASPNIMLKLINNATTSDGRPMYLQASVNDAGTGINVLSRLSGALFSISDFSGADDTATELGLLTMSTTDNIADLRQGDGLDFKTGDDFSITAGGTAYPIDLSGSNTVADII